MHYFIRKRRIGIRLKQCYIPAGRGLNSKGTFVSSNKGSNKSSNAYSQIRKGTSEGLFLNKEPHPPDKNDA